MGWRKPLLQKMRALLLLTLFLVACPMSTPQKPVDVFRTLARDQREHVLEYLMWFESVDCVRGFSPGRCADETLEGLLEACLMSSTANYFRNFIYSVATREDRGVSEVAMSDARKSTEARFIGRMEQVRKGQKFEMTW